MLDLELVTAPTDNGLAIVSLAEMKASLRIRTDALDAQISNAVIEAAAAFHGRDGELNRTVFPTTWRRHFSSFPGKCGPVRLPYPPLIEVVSILYDDGSSPLSEVVSADVVVREVDMIPEITFVDRVTGWPRWSTYHPRAVAVTYRAGYTTYPDNLKKLVKMLAAHFFENPEATINEPRQMMVNRAINFGHQYLVDKLRVPVAMDGWE